MDPILFVNLLFLVKYHRKHQPNYTGNCILELFYFFNQYPNLQILSTHCQILELQIEREGFSCSKVFWQSTNFLSTYPLFKFHSGSIPKLSFLKYMLTGIDVWVSYYSFIGTLMFSDKIFHNLMSISYSPLPYHLKDR